MSKIPGQGDTWPGIRSREGNVTKMHFQALAEALRDARPIDPGPVDIGTLSGLNVAADHEIAIGVWRRCVENIADVCRGENGRFDRTRFLRACGVSGK